jgi:PilZ domain
MLRPGKRRAFVVTPKGEKLEKRGVNEALTVLPHLVLFGLLLAGLTVGIQLWLNDRVTPGLQVSFFWGAINLFLLTLAILTANELPQWRNMFRLPRRIPCELASGNVRVSGFTKNINENGVCVEVTKPLLLTSGLVTVCLHNYKGDKVALKGIVTRQERLETGLDVGVSFVEQDETGITAITEQMFNPPTTWTSVKEHEPGIWKSMWLLVTALRSAWQSRRPARRHFPRVKCQLECEIEFHGHSYSGYTEDISFAGIAVAIDEDFSHASGPALLLLEGMTLKVTLIGALRYGRRTVAQFRVESIDKGEERWLALNMSGC